MAYDFKTIEKKWQKYWEENKLFKSDEPETAADKKKFYLLEKSLDKNAVLVV